MFERWNWLDKIEFRNFYGYTDHEEYEDWVIEKAIIYGCYRISLETGHLVRDALGEDGFPGSLTKKQAEAVKETAAWSANHMLKQNLDWVRGSRSISLGQISTGVTHPDEPDYLIPWVVTELVSVGLRSNIIATNLKEEETRDNLLNRDPNDVFLPTWDALEKIYVRKRGQGSESLKAGIIQLFLSSKLLERFMKGLI